jgi:hypothetical protein
MLDEFRPLTITDVAKQLQTDPFEVMRLLVAAKAVPEGLVFTPEHVERLRPVVAKR